LTALGFLRMLPVLQRLGDAYGFYFAQFCSKPTRQKGWQREWANEVFSERELMLTHVHVRYMQSPLRLSFVCRLCVCNARAVRPTQLVKIFRNVSSPFGTLVTH